MYGTRVFELEGRDIGRPLFPESKQTEQDLARENGWANKIAGTDTRTPVTVYLKAGEKLDSMMSPGSPDRMTDETGEIEV